LGAADLGGKLPERCSDGDEGWVLQTKLDQKLDITVRGGTGSLEDIELRLRLEPDRSCVEAMAAKADTGFRMRGDAREKKEKRRRRVRGDQEPHPRGVPMAARERYGSRRWQMSCE
jgi:hypothetical protein